MAAADYTDSTTLKSELGIIDSTDDARLSRAVTDASRIIDALCMRADGDFAAQTLTRTFDVPRQRTKQPYWSDERRWYAQKLSVPPLLSITTLKTDEDGDGTYEVTWTASTDYLLYPLNAGTTGDPYREIHVQETTGRYAFPVGQNRVQIVGSWGESSAVPSAIRRATLLLATRLYKRPDAPFAVMGDAAIGVIYVRKTDPDVVLILEQAGYIDQWTVV